MYRDASPSLQVRRAAITGSLKRLPHYYTILLRKSNEKLKMVFSHLTCRRPTENRVIGCARISRILSWGLSESLHSFTARIVLDHVLSGSTFALPIERLILFLNCWISHRVSYLVRFKNSSNVNIISWPLLCCERKFPAPFINLHHSFQRLFEYAHMAWTMEQTQLVLVSLKSDFLRYKFWMTSQCIDK